MKTKPKALRVSTKVALALAAIIFTLTSAHLIFQHLNLNIYKELHAQIFEISNRVDLDDESSIGTWVSQALFIFIFLSAGLAGRLNAKKEARRLWYAIGLIALIFSIDEVASIHEFILQILHLIFFQENTPTLLSNAWLIIIPVVMLISLWLITQLIKYIPRKTMMQFIVGGTLFLIGAVLIDILASTTPKNTFMNQGILVAIEETLELLGSAIVFYATVRYIEDNHAQKIKKSVSLITKP